MFEIVMGIDDFLIQLVKYCTHIAVQEIKSGYWGAGGKAVGLDDIRALLAGSTEKAEEF